MEDDKEYRLRKATTDDFDDIGRIYERAFGHTEGLVRYFQGMNTYLQFCVNQGYAYVVEDDSVVGVALAYEIPSMLEGIVLYIELLAVDPDYQGRGIGKALIEKIEQDAFCKGIKEISIRTACYLESYLIYRHWGFIDSQSNLQYLEKRVKGREDNSGEEK